MKKIYLLAAVLFSAVSFGQVVISQFYGAGGNTGATYNIDYVELFNKTNAPISINGWSIQYNSATGTSAWLLNALPNATIPAYSYYLVTFGTPSATNGVALPVTVDFNYTGTTPAPLNLSGANGRLALVSIATAKPAGCITTDLIDMVGYGTGNCFETQAMAALTATTAGLRATGGCTDTGNNSNDFTAVAANSVAIPRNSTTAINDCTLATKEFGNISGLKVFPVPANNILNVTSDSFATKNVEVYNMLGAKVLSSEVINGTVNISSLTRGIYVIK
ncbi:MAG: lamin tail domain-containing protein, partial [Limnohabitans sp.]|nr:lamin tail domain-containing protein [Limnohabitans sp.]